MTAGSSVLLARKARTPADTCCKFARSTTDAIANPADHPGMLIIAALEKMPL